MWLLEIEEKKKTRMSVNGRCLLLLTEESAQLDRFYCCLVEASKIAHAIPVLYERWGSGGRACKSPAHLIFGPAAVVEMHQDGLSMAVHIIRNRVVITYLRV